MRRLACLASLALGACAAPPPAKPVSERPTIVSLNPCADAILAEVAGPDQLLAISHYSHDPRASSMEAEDAARYRSTGGTVEEILALDPEIVVASSFLAPATRAALSDFGIRVETVGTVSSIEEAFAQVDALAELAGDLVGGERLAARMRAALDQPVRKRSSAILWQPGGIVPGRGALVSELMERAGFWSLSASNGLEQADYLSLEEVLSDPPRYLFVAGSERGQRHPALAKSNRMRAVTMPANLLYCGGPTIIRAMDFFEGVRGEMS